MKIKSIILPLFAVFALTISPVAVARNHDSGGGFRFFLGCDDLVEKAAEGNVVSVRKLIEKECNVNAKNDYENTALIMAAFNGHAEVAKVLIAAGANVNVKNKYATALDLAAGNGHAEIAKMFIAAGANVDAANEFGWTALMAAAKYGHSEVAKMLIAAEADVNTQLTNDSENYVRGDTALSVAKQEGHTDIVAILQTEIDRIEREKLVIEREKLLEAQRIEREKFIAENPLYHSVQNGTADDIAALFAGQRINPNKPDNTGNRPLHYAVQSGDALKVQVLLKNSANPNAVNKVGITPLILAMQKNEREMVGLMLTRKADMDKVDLQGRSAWDYLDFYSETAESVKAVLGYTDEGWTEQQWYYEEKRLSNEWEQEARTEAEREERQRREQIALAERKREEEERRRQQAEQNRREAEARAERQRQESAKFWGGVLEVGLDVLEVYVDAKSQAETTAPKVPVPSVSSSSSSNTTRQSPAPVETRKPNTRADGMEAADCVHYEDKKIDKLNSHGFRLSQITLTNKCPYDLFVEYRNKLYAAKPLSLFYTFEYFKGVWIESYYACRAPAVPAQLSPGYICVWK